MHHFQHKIFKLCQELGDEFVWMRALLYPEINRFADSSESGQFDDRLIEISESTELASFSKRVLPGEPVQGSLAIALTPVDKVTADRCWINPIEFKMSYVAWQHSDELVRAYVPALDLSIVKQGKVDPKFVGQMRKEIKSCLLRIGALSDLRRLAFLQNFGPLSIVESISDISLPSAKDIAKEEPTEKEKRELPEVANRLDRKPRKRKGRTQRSMPAFHICLLYTSPSPRPY